MPEYIEREALISNLKDLPEQERIEYMGIYDLVKSQTTVEVIRCRDCKFATELDKHCELNRAIYKHCSLLRGEPTDYVWHKYKRYYKNYSLVEADDYCSYGERKDGDNK